MQSVALIVPSETYRAEAFLNAAARLGIDVMIVSDTPQALANVMGDHFLRAPLDDPQATADLIVEMAARRPIDGVVGVDDGGALAGAIAAQRLNLVHNDPIAVAATRDKATMRRLASRSGVRQPNFRVAEVRDSCSIGDVVGELADTIGYPVVIKPSSLSASRGVMRADDREGARRAGEWAHEIAIAAGAQAGAPLLVEEFVPGDEVALEGRLRDGELECLAIFDKPEPLVGPYFEETIYVTPSRHPMSVQAQVITTIAVACQALGLTEGPVHGEARLRRIGPTASDVEVVFVEVAARTIGGRCSKVLTFNGDLGIEEIVLSDALGRDMATIERSNDASGVLMLPIKERGQLIEVARQSEARRVPCVTGVEITVAPGRRLTPFPESDRYLGFVFARGDSPERVVEALREAEQTLDVRIEPDHVMTPAS